MEEFKIIDGYSNYEVSNLGNIRRIGKDTNRKLQSDKKGYMVISIMGDDLKRKTLRVHILVAKAFINNPNPNKYDQVNHIDGVKYHNDVENLEWSNNSLNQKHAFEMGLQEPNIGELNPRSIVTKEDVLEIRENKENLTYSELGKIYGLTKSGINNIMRRKTWKHV